MVKRNYKEGSLFSVPLKPEGFAVGLIARCARKRGPILAHFFPNKYLSIPTAADLISLESKDVMKAWIVSDLGIINGEWKIIGELPNFNRSQWKVPNFVRREEFSGRVWLVTYSDDDPNLVISEERVAEADVVNLEPDYLRGYGAVEKRLSKIIC